MTHCARSGFSMLQMSIVLAIGAMLLAASLPGGDAGGQMMKTRITLERMEAIENATMQFMTQNQRRPYPSDLTASLGSAAFGTELAVPTDYSSIPTTHFTNDTGLSFTRTSGSNLLTGGSSGTLANGRMASGTGIPTGSWIEGIPSSSEVMLNKPATSSGTATVYFRNPVVAGGVPVKALGLADEYAMDGFGRRIVYMMDQRTATRNGCMSLQNNNRQGAVALSSGSSFASGTYDMVMWALLSHGEDSQGAISMQGSALGSRIKTGNVDTSTLANAFYDGSQANSFTYYGLVNKNGTSTFDDIVWTNQATKNTCGMGQVASFRDFRITGGGSADGTSLNAAFGDINGDGWQDMVIGVPQQNVVRVIYGRRDSWPEPNTAYDTTALDGTNGFTIGKGAATMSNFGRYVYVGDINGDGYDDVIAGGTPVAASDISYGVTFGSRMPAASMDINSYDGTTGFTIAGLGAGSASWAAVGDVNGDRYDDIALLFEQTAGNWAQGVLFGKASSFSNVTFNITLLNGTNGVYFNVASPSTTNGDVSHGTTTTTGIDRRMTAICNLNGDGYKDLIIPGALTGSATTGQQRVYVQLGAASWSNSSGYIDPSSASAMLRFDTSTAHPATYDIKGIACGDITSDRRDDVLIYVKNTSTSQEYIYVYTGRASFSSVNLDTAYDMRFDLGTGPSWQVATTPPIMVIGDINNDGRNDLALSRRDDGPYIGVSGTTFTIYTNTTGTQRAGAGITYILFQPSSWGTMPTLNKDFFAYNYTGTDGGKLAGAVANDGLELQAVGDINKDGRADLLFSSKVNPTGGYLVFGKSTWPWVYDMNCTRDKTGAHCPTQIGRK